MGDFSFEMKKKMEWRELKEKENVNLKLTHTKSRFIQFSWKIVVIKDWDGDNPEKRVDLR